MTNEEIKKGIENYKALRFEDYKFSFLILKPNAAKHYGDILGKIEEDQFIIANQYAIMDYETVNMALHPDVKLSKYLVPITRMYFDFYGNKAILVVLAKRDISYENFTIQVLRLKKYLRDKFELSYIAHAFDTSKLGQKNEHQKLVILSENGEPVKKDSMNDEGTYMVFFTNEIHSPDADVEKTIKEMKILKSMCVISQENVIPRTIINSMKRYETFEFLKDL